MASINEVYGGNFQQQAVNEKALYAANLYASNISHKQFSFRNDSKEMWECNNMKPDIIKALVEQTQSNNPHVRLVHIPKTSNDINMFPYLINGPVEYFTLIDISKVGESRTQIYSLYITPLLMEAF